MITENDRLLVAALRAEQALLRDEGERLDHWMAITERRGRWVDGHEQIAFRAALRSLEIRQLVAHSQLVRRTAN